MSYLPRDVTLYLLEMWQNASLTNYAHLVLAIAILGWFIGRYGRRVGA